jgi:endonuclease III
VLPVDDDVSRVVMRLMGLPNERHRAGAKRLLAAGLPKNLNVYREANLYLRHHAQHSCLVVAPHCTVCPLRPECRAADSIQRRHAPA